MDGLFKNFGWGGATQASKPPSLIYTILIHATALGAEPDSSTSCELLLQKPDTVRPGDFQALAMQAGQRTQCSCMANLTYEIIVKTDQTEDKILHAKDPEDKILAFMPKTPTEGY